MSRGPPLGTLACRSSRPEHSCRLPTPGRPSYFRNRTVPGRVSKVSLGDIALLHGRGMATLCQREKQWRLFLWGFLTSPSGIHAPPPIPCFPVVPPYPGSRSGTKRDREKVEGALVTLHGQRAVLNVYSLPLCHGAGAQLPALWAPV